MNKWSEEREDRLTALVAQGLTHSQIGREIGLSRRAITGKIKRMGIQGPPVKPSIWTAERVETLKCMQAKGRSASQIAAALDCGMTRNSVIGKFHRLGLVGADRPKPVSVVPILKASTKQRVNNNPIGFNHTKRAVGKARPVAMRQPALVVVPRHGQVLFVDRPYDRCAFIADDPKAGPIGQLMCCGEAVKPGKSYCADHHAVCFVKVIRHGQGGMVGFGGLGRFSTASSENGGILAA